MSYCSTKTRSTSKGDLLWRLDRLRSAKRGPTLGLCQIRQLRGQYVKWQASRDPLQNAPSNSSPRHGCPRLRRDPPRWRRWTTRPLGEKLPDSCSRRRRRRRCPLQRAEKRQHRPTPSRPLKPSGRTPRKCGHAQGRPRRQPPHLPSPTVDVLCQPAAPQPPQFSSWETTTSLEGRGRTLCLSSIRCLRERTGKKRAPLPFSSQHFLVNPDGQLHVTLYSSMCITMVLFWRKVRQLIGQINLFEKLTLKSYFSVVKDWKYISPLFFVWTDDVI